MAGKDFSPEPLKSSICVPILKSSMVRTGFVSDFRRAICFWPSSWVLCHQGSSWRVGSSVDTPEGPELQVVLAEEVWGGASGTQGRNEPSSEEIRWYDTNSKNSNIDVQRFSDRLWPRQSLRSLFFSPTLFGGKSEQILMSSILGQKIKNRNVLLFSATSFSRLLLFLTYLKVQGVESFRCFYLLKI